MTNQTAHLCPRRTRIRAWVKTHKAWVHSAAVLTCSAALATALSLYSRNAVPPSSASKMASIQSQIRQDITHSAHLLQLTSDQATWFRSGYSPEDLFRSIETLNSPILMTTFCKELALASEDWILAAEKEILHLASHSPCYYSARNRLAKSQLKLANEWTKHQKQLVRTHSYPTAQKLISQGSSLRPHEVAFIFEVTLHPETPSRLPKIQKVLDRKGLHAQFAFTPEAARKYSSLVRGLLEKSHTVAILELPDSKNKSESILPLRQRSLEGQRDFFASAREALPSSPQVFYSVPESNNLPSAAGPNASQPAQSSIAFSDGIRPVPLTPNADLRDWKGHPISVFKRFHDLLSLSSPNEGLMIRLRASQWTTSVVFEEMIAHLAQFPVAVATFAAPTLSPQTLPQTPLAVAHSASQRLASKTPTLLKGQKLRKLARAKKQKRPRQSA